MAAELRILLIILDRAIAFHNLIATARAELEKLSNELGQLQAHLNDAGEMYKKTNVFKENEKQIRKLAYEVEDTIDICLTKKAASAKSKNIILKVKTFFSSGMEQKVRYLRKGSVANALKLISAPVQPGPQNAGMQQEMGNLNVESMYRDLGDDMKACFLYTGLFPPNYEIPASTLTQLWIAESFIHPPHGRTSEECADEVLKHLISQHMLKAEKKRLDQVKTCKVDDSFREFCKEKAEELNLFTVIKPPVHEGRDLYRLCFHSDPSNFLSEQPRPNRPYVRSFLCLLEEPLGLDPEHMSTIPNAFKPLRVLSCESTKLDKLPDIQKLILLKHVTLFIDRLDFLPTEISHLLNLQTLIVKTTSDNIKVKANIWKMMQLRHLKTKVFFILDDKKWNRRAARNLQTLSRLSPKSCTKDLHEKAPNLRKLGIRGELDGLFEKFSLVNFTHLENLTLENYLSYGAEHAKPLKCLPYLQAFPANLKKLSLSKTYLIWDRHMPLLADIHTLEVLKVRDHAFKGANWNVNRAFKNLRYLLIENTDLETWTVPADHFPKLQWLGIKICSLKELPVGLRGRHNLEAVIV